MKKNTIAIADDHKLFRDGVVELINGFNNFTVTIEADNGTDLIHQIESKGIPDILLLDINMKQMDGYATAEWLKQHHPDVKILVLSMYENENAVIRMIKLGVKGYLLKDIRRNELEEALNAIATKGFFYTDLMTGRLINMVHSLEDLKSSKSTREILSINHKETEFLKWVCTELTYKEIAEQMNLSPHTIDGYRDALFEKLGIKSRVGLALYAIKNNIVLLD